MTSEQPLPPGPPETAAPSQTASALAAREPLGLVMSGGGARAAYQVGFLRSLARRHPTLALPILTGVSAGAINAAYLACRPESLRDKTEELVRLWSGLTTERVFRAGSASLATSVMRWGARLMMGRASAVSRTRGLVDTAPLAELLAELFRSQEGELPGIAENIARGSLRALAITTSSYSTGQSITWVQGSSIENWERAHRRSELCALRLEHVLASAALPLFFPAVQVGNRWYGDGGIRLTAPLSPAIHLGATRVLAISTRYGRSRAEADSPTSDAYPPPAQVIGVLFNAVFLDQFDADALRLERVNQLISALPEEKRAGLRPIRLLLLRPSRDLGKLANDYEAALPKTFRFLTRGLGTRQIRSNDLLSLVMFQSDYLARLIELGEADADARAADIDAFVAG